MADKKTDKKTPDDKPLGHNPFAALSTMKAPEQSAASSPPAAAAKKAPVRFAEKVVVRKEKKGHGGKTVTVVQGVLPNWRDETATALKKSLGCGARVDDDGSIVVQGDLLERVIAFFETEGAKKIVRGS
ncbi:MAG: translation initiation factor [Deltaproteobacteria bacterium]|nr:translation initiation factor [Deltaproteobacteria bacterium]